MPGVVWIFSLPIYHLTASTPNSTSDGRSPCRPEFCLSLACRPRVLERRVGRPRPIAVFTVHFAGMDGILCHEAAAQHMVRFRVPALLSWFWIFMGPRLWFRGHGTGRALSRGEPRVRLLFQLGRAEPHCLSWNLHLEDDANEKESRRLDPACWQAVACLVAPRPQCKQG